MPDNLIQLFPGFEQRSVDVGEAVHIHAIIGGSGTTAVAARPSADPGTVAPGRASMAERLTVVAADLRGYGDSSKPSGSPDHGNYAKRVMAQDQVSLMRNLGFDRFDVLAHDRGARVAHRLAMDHPDTVSRLILLDIAPTLAMYGQTTETFARSYWHWFFLIQPAPLPERLIEADPAAYVCRCDGAPQCGSGPLRPQGPRRVPTLYRIARRGSWLVRGLPGLRWHRPGA